MVRFIFAVLVATELLGQGKSTQARTGEAPGRSRRPEAASEADPRGIIRGSVVGAGNEPLRKVVVTLRGSRGSGAWALTTDASGTFVFDRLPAGTYALSADRTGYVRTEYGAKPGVRASGASITIASGQELGGITLRMIPHAVLAGKVLDEDGEPVQGATVQVLRERWLNGRRQLLPQHGDNTNDLGEYRLSGLAPGRYFLRVDKRPTRESMYDSRQNVGPRQNADRMGYPQLYYPGVTEQGQAAPITLGAGQQMIGVDFQLRKAPMFRIRGKVLDESGKPAQFVGVAAVPADGFDGARGMGMGRGVDGAFEIPDLLPGSYTLIANRMTREERTRSSARLPVQVGNRDLEDVVLILSRAFDVSGVVRAAGEGASVGSARVLLESLEAGPPFGGGAADSQTKPDGSFVFSGVSEGKYRFVVQGMPPGTYLKSVMVQGQDITAGAAISASATGIEITLAANAPEVTGTVLNSEKHPVAGASVVLVPEASKQPQYWLHKTTTSDHGGGFVFHGVVPGQYTAYAFTDIEEGSWHSPEVLKQFDGKGVALKLSEGAKESIQLIAVP